MTQSVGQRRTTYLVNNDVLRRHPAYKAERAERCEEVPGHPIPDEAPYEAVHEEPLAGYGLSLARVVTAC